MIDGSLVSRALTCEQIARQIGLSRSRVSQVLSREGVKPAAVLGKLKLYEPSDVSFLFSDGTAEELLPAIEAAHLIGMAPSEFRDIVIRFKIKRFHVDGSPKYRESIIREFAVHHGYPFRTEPTAPEQRAWYRQQSRMVAARARRTGRLVPLPCIECGSTERVHGHHGDYTKPLVVEWLCVECHSRLHEPYGPHKYMAPKPPRSPREPREVPIRPKKDYPKGLTHIERRHRRDQIVSRLRNGESPDCLAVEFNLLRSYVLKMARDSGVMIAARKGRPRKCVA